MTDNRDAADNRRGRAITPLAFGAFELLAAERLLLHDGQPAQIGARALDLLIVLTERPGEVVSKRELMSRAWPDLTVDESNLRFQVAALRKALGDGRSGTRYVTNVPGRGYCFVAPLSRPDSPRDEAAPHPRARAPTLPPRPQRVVGRDEAVREVTQRLTAKRFVTIAGPGGIGKTTVAVHVAHDLLREFDGDIHFFSLSPINDPALVPTAIASALGLLVQSDNATPAIIAFLRDRRLLLVLDNCEHVIAASAVLAEQIRQQAPEVHILATSREDLRVEGEHIYRLAALTSHPAPAEAIPAEILAYPAAQLFIERLVASGYPFQESDDSAAVVSEICRKLDGLPLAIELAAGSAGAYGLRKTADLLDNRLDLLRQGRRTAVSRHQTLAATLDWSYETLSNVERVVFRRLAAFAGTFSLEACLGIVADDEVGMADVLETVGSLVKKSLVAPDGVDPEVRYRLLDTTRAYAREKLRESGEADATAQRHAAYYRALLSRLQLDGSASRRADGYAGYVEHLSDVRSALQWSFRDESHRQLAISLAASAIPLFLGLSLLTEAHEWARRAMQLLDERTQGTRLEMELQAALAMTGMFTQGNSEDIRLALMTSLELSQKMKEPLHELRTLIGLHTFHHRHGDQRDCLAYARRGEVIAQQIQTPAAMALAHSALGIGYHFFGDQQLARRHLEQARNLAVRSGERGVGTFGLDYPAFAPAFLARALWLQGYPDQAAAAARRSVEAAEELSQPITLCVVLLAARSIFFLTGDDDTAEDYVEQFHEHADRHSLMPYQQMGLGLKGALLVRQGKAEEGVRLLSDALDELQRLRYGLLTTELNSALAEGLAAMGRVDEALALADQTLELVERGGDLYWMPEILRIKADLLLSAAQPDERQADACYLRSLELARQQSALGWELRTAMGLARLKLQAGQRDTARSLLAPVYERFTEGLESSDLRNARLLLDAMSPPGGK
jgi:predicted ATPase/DNA-binding winged helix-turn-helix (wHTH) protein